MFCLVKERVEVECMYNASQDHKTPVENKTKVCQIRPQGENKADWTMIVFSGSRQGKNKNCRTRIELNWTDFSLVSVYFNFGMSSSSSWFFILVLVLLLRLVLSQDKTRPSQDKKRQWESQDKTRQSQEDKSRQSQDHEKARTRQRQDRFRLVKDKQDRFRLIKDKTG